MELRRKLLSNLSIKPSG
jgi:hypothetical protein